MPSGIPLDANYKTLSCQLGGLHLNGIVTYPPTVPAINGGTAQSLTVLSIDDTDVITVAPIIPPGAISGYLRVKIGNTGVDAVDFHYIPLYQ